MAQNNVVYIAPLEEQEFDELGVYVECVGKGTVCIHVLDVRVLIQPKWGTVHHCQLA